MSMSMTIAIAIPPPLSTSSTMTWLTDQISLRNTQSASPVFTLAALVCFLFYFSLAPYYPNHKQRAWILTALASSFMTLTSLPFAFDWLMAGASVGAVKFRDGSLDHSFNDGLSVIVNRAFQAYLVWSVFSLSSFYFSFYHFTVISP